MAKTVNEILEESKGLNLHDVLVIGVTTDESGSVTGLEMNTTLQSGLSVTHMLHKVLFELSSEHVRAVIREAKQNMEATNESA